MLDYFEKRYVVNLPSRTDRRRDMEAELARVRAPEFEFFPAFSFSDAAPFHRLGSRGAYMSHLAIMESSVESRNLLMLQDDLNFVKDRRKLSIVKSLPADWAIFYGSRNFAPREGAGILRLVAPNEEFTGFYFAAVNGPVIGKLVEALKVFLSRERDHPFGGPMPIDGAFNIFRQQNPSLKVFESSPALGHQRSSRSDCSERKWFDNKITGFAVDVARRLRNHI